MTDRLPEPIDPLELMEPADVARVVSGGNGYHHDEASQALSAPLADPGACPALPDYARLDPGLGSDAGLWIDSYVDYARAVSPMTPRLFHESAALALVSMAIARRAVLRMPYGDVYPNLFILWLANTTLYRKSTALLVARDVVRRVFPHLLAAQDTTPEAFLSDLAGMQPANYEKMSVAEQTAWTKERNFSAQRGWILDEMSGLLAGAGKDYNAGLLEALLRFYDCDPQFTRSTRSQGRVVVKNSYLTLIGASTPAAMAAHLNVERLWSNGWWPRFAILTPDTDRPEWQEAKDTQEPAELLSGLEHLYKRLPAMNWPETPEAVTMYISSEAFEAHKRYNKAVSYDLLTDELPGQLWGAYGRLPTHLLKIAMILAALDWQEAQACRIEIRHLARAMAIAESWRESVHRAVETATVSDFDRLSLRIIRAVSRYPDGATMRDIYRIVHDRTPGEVELIVIDMVTAGMLEAVEPEQGKRGRPARRYRLVTD